MKKALLIVLSVLGLGYSVDTFGQAYTIEKDTARGVANGTSLDVHNKVTNTTASPLTLTWMVTLHTVPASWLANNYGICDNQTCINFASNSDLNKPFQSTLNPNEEMDLKFTMVFPSGNSLVGGPYYVTVNVTDGVTPMNTTYAVGRWATNVSSLSRTQDNIVLYPNPARDEINVLFSPGVKNIAVYNLIGKPVKVYNVSGNSAHLDIASIPSGIYFARLVDGQGRVIATRKFTRQ